MNNIINEIYIKYNFPSNERLFNLVKKDNQDITRNDIKSFLESQKEYQQTYLSCYKKKHLITYSYP